MFIAANIVSCRLRHQDAGCTHRQFNKLVAVTILQSVTFLCKFLCTGGGGGAPTFRIAPVLQWGKAGPVCQVPITLHYRAKHSDHTHICSSKGHDYSLKGSLYVLSVLRSLEREECDNTTLAISSPI
jgi:hypothetical protein